MSDELGNVRRELREAHDALVAAERAIQLVLRHSGQREYANKRHRVLKGAGSCQTCGAEAQANRSRCIDCGRKAAATEKRRKERAA